MSVPDPIVIVGGSLSALRMVEALRRFGCGDPITVIGDEPHLPYNRPPLSKVALNSDVTHAELAFPIRESLDDLTWVLGDRVTAADLNQRTVTTEDGNTYSYRALIAATGLRPRRLEPSDRPQKGRFVLRSLDDARLIRACAAPGTRVVIAGGGFIACEVAASLRQRDVDVTIVSHSRLPMQRALGEQLAGELKHRHEEHGVRFHFETRIKHILGGSHVTGVALEDGTRLDCDLLVEAIGSRFNTEWLAGNDVNVDEGILTDGRMRVLKASGDAHQGVFAIGDVARFPNPRFGGQPLAVGHWNIPTETAKRAAKVLAAELTGDLGQPPAIFDPVPSFWTDQYDTHLLAYGIPALGTETRLLEGDIRGDSVHGYYREGELIGVAGIGYRSHLMSLRAHVGIGYGSGAPAPQPTTL